MARIVIGIPCYGDVPSEVLSDYFRLAYHCGRRIPEHDFFLAVKGKSEQFRARNHIVEAAFQVQADYLFFLDDDHIIDHEGTMGGGQAYDIIRRLIAHDKDIVGGLYYQRQGECAPVAMKRGAGDGYTFLGLHELTKGLQQVDVVGGGCMLINMRVFGQLNTPFFEPESTAGYGTDIQLCKKAAEQGFTVWLDSSFEIGHIRREPVVVTSQNRQQFVSDLVPGEVRQALDLPFVYKKLFEDAVQFTGAKTMEEMGTLGNSFLYRRDEFHGSDIEWYREYAIQRVCRQVWLNTYQADKRHMVEFMLSSIFQMGGPRDILDFGCGIGIPAYTLAGMGHRVTACDVKGAGTLNFLRWRTQVNGLSLTIHESETDIPPLGSATFDVIIAMDVLEHLKTWKWVLRDLVNRLKPGGVLFCNNGTLDDVTHPEHYLLASKDFVLECVSLDMKPANQFTYVKKVGVRDVAPVG